MTTLDEVRMRDALWRAEELEEQISDVFRDRRWLLARVDELAEALKGLHDDNVDYLRLNHLGGYDNHWLKAARAALARLGHCACGFTGGDVAHLCHVPQKGPNHD